MVDTRILLIGADGQLARELRRELSTLGKVTVAARSGGDVPIDLAEPTAFADRVRSLQPGWIVNAAAHTAVDKAESERELAFVINATAPGVLASVAAEVGALLVHYSTDYVFDGTGSRPYLEDDPTSPQSVYGQSKLAGEAAIAAAGAAHLILRTSWVYGLAGNNFMRTMRRLARERCELRVVADQRGAPTWSRHIAQATAQMLARLGQDRAAWQRLSGVYHLVSQGETTWHGFAEAIVAHQRQREPVSVERIVPITTQEYPVPAPRPAYSVLDTSKLFDAFGIRLPDWRIALAQVQEELDREPI